MNLTLIIKPQAEDDISAAYLWYEDQHKGLGEEFLAELDTVIELMMQFSEGFQERYRHTRIAFMGRFPFGIHYITDEGAIMVLAVLHTGRNPEIWKRDERG